jgi:hypothetical protein
LGYLVCICGIIISLILPWLIQTFIVLRDTFFEGNHERQNGPARCKLMTCENHSSLPGCTEDGNTNSRQVPAPGGTQSCSFTLSDAPSLVPQGQFCSSNTCWASTLTMMLSYRDHQGYSTDTVLKMLGPVYVDKYKNNQGLTQDEFIQITTRLGLTGQSGFLDLDEIRDMLQKCFLYQGETYISNRLWKNEIHS